MMLWRKQLTRIFQGERFVPTKIAWNELDLRPVILADHVNGAEFFRIKTPRGLGTPATSHQKMIFAPNWSSLGLPLVTRVVAKPAVDVPIVVPGLPAITTL